MLRKPWYATIYIYIILYILYICISITGGVVAVWLAVGVVPHVSQFLLLLLIFFPIRIAAAVLLVVRRGLELHVNCIIMFFVFYMSSRCQIIISGYPPDRH